VEEQKAGNILLYRLSPLERDKRVRPEMEEIKDQICTKAPSFSGSPLLGVPDPAKAGERKERSSEGTDKRMRWHAIYTRPCWERKVEKQISDLFGIETWCPVRKVFRQWSDRMKLIEEPVFRSYVFVRVEEKDRSKVLSVDGVVDFVRVQGQPAKVREEEIEAIKEFLEEHNNVEVHALAPGTRIKINNVAFGDNDGIVKSVEGDKVILELEGLKWKLTANVAEVRVVG